MSIVLWYKLNGSSLGDDSSGFSRAMGNAGVSSFSDSDLGNVAFFDGSSYLSLASSQVPAALKGASSRTISLWVKTSSSASTAIYGNGTPFAHSRFRGRVSGGTLYGIDLHTATANGSISVPQGTWTHFVCTFDSGTSSLKTYIDGVLDSSTVQTRLHTGSSTFSIGRDPTNLSYAYFQGYVSDFRVYDGELDATAISTLNNAGPLGAGTVESNEDPDPDPEPESQSAPDTAGTDAEIDGHAPLLWYKLNGSNSNLGEDSSDSALDMVNAGAVTSVSDSEFGNVAFFNGSSSSYLSLSSSSLVPAAMLGSSSRTISCWAKTTLATTGALYGNGSNFAHRRFRAFLSGGTTFGIDLHTNAVNGSIVNPLDTWAHLVCTFDRDTSVLNTYVDGALSASSVQSRLDTGSGTFGIGKDFSNPLYAHFGGHVSDFRVYDVALDAASIASLANAGPLGALSSATEAAATEDGGAGGAGGTVGAGDTEEEIGTLVAQMYIGKADLTWDSVPEASTYTLTQTLSGGLESVSAKLLSGLSFTAKKLRPGSHYTFKLYTDLDPVNPAGLVHGTTIGKNVSLNNVFETGDNIKISIPGFRTKTGAKFVRRGERVEFSPGVPIVLAFDPDEGPGQNATLGLTNNTDATVSFDEETDEVSVDGITCAVGDYVVIDGKKMTVVDI